MGIQNVGASPSNLIRFDAHNIQSPNFNMTINGRSGVLDGLGGVAFGALIFLCASESLWISVCGAMVICIGLFLILLAIPLFGKPILHISHEGLMTPYYGYIPWTAIQGIDKQEREHRGVKFSPILIFYIPDLKRYQSQFHPIRRMFSTGNRISVILRSSDMKPDDLLSIVRELWTKQTGRSHPWFSCASDEVNEAYRRIDDATKHTKNQMDDIQRVAENMDDQKATVLLGTLRSNDAQWKANWKTINDDRKKTNNLILWVSMVLVLLIVIKLVLMFST